MRSPCRACTCPAGFLAAGFLAAGFLAAGFLAAGFLAAGFLAAGFLAVAFFAMAFFAVAFFAVAFFAVAFFAVAFLAVAFLAVAFLAVAFFAVAFLAALVVGFFFLLLGMVRLLGDRCVTHPSSPKAARHGSEVARASGELVYPLASESGGTGRRAGLRIRWPRGRGSSSLPSRTAVTSEERSGDRIIPRRTEASCSRIAHANPAC